MTSAAALDRDVTLSHYLAMHRIRVFEQAVLDLRAQDHVKGSVHPCLGQESAPVGVLAAARPKDPIVATYRGHGWAVASGVPMSDIAAEILGREGGTNNGRGGSAYLSAPGTRFIGENSIVGAGLPVAAGMALASRVRGLDEVAIVSFGDGATNQGAAHEAFVMAVARGLPVLFVCENNGWSEMTPIGATVPVPLAERAAAYGMATWTVDGRDVVSVAHAARTALGHARDTPAPVFLEILVPRIAGHYNADIEHYRDESDKTEARERDPLQFSRSQLLAAGLAESDLTTAEAEIGAQVAQALEDALQRPVAAGDVHEHVTASRPISRPSPHTSGREVTYGLAINEALRREMAARPETVLFGEDVAIPGGVFGVSRGLRREFGEGRVFDTPIAEAAILGAAVGASQRGLRPIVEIMWADFLLVALDQLVNQAANVRYLSEGRATAPMLVRTQQGVTPGSCAQHCQSLEALLTHIPGLKVGLPGTPADGYAMTRAAIEDPDPVILIEARSLYLTKGMVDFEAAPETVGGSVLRREGKDLLIVTWGAMQHACMEAAARLHDDGIDAGVLDLRWLAPLDFDAIRTHLATHSGKLVIAHEANVTGGFGAEVAARVASDALDVLDGPILRVGTPDSRIPAAPSLQAALVPSVGSIVAAAQRLGDF